MKPEIFSRTDYKGQRWFVRLGERVYLSTNNAGFTSYDAAKVIADQLAVDPDSVEQAPPPPEKKPAVIRGDYSGSRSYRLPRPINIDPTTPDGFRDITASSGIKTAWARKVQTLESRLARVLADDPYNFDRIKTLRKSLSESLIGQQYA